MSYEFLDGAEAITRSAINCGCDFFAGYPISPATKIHLGMMNTLPRTGGIAVQGEDEIASISMCLAASAAGRKVMTATSGPGMSLYSENIGFALMAELPLVIVNVQRLGPATGGATTGAEGDILFMKNITSGGIPMVVLSPSSIESIFRIMPKAFNLAEILRTPVIVLASKDLVMSKDTVKVEKKGSIKLQKRKIFQGIGDYLPYGVKKTADVPDFLALGSKILNRVSTSMHDEKGYLTKDPAKIERKILHLSQKITTRLKLIESARYYPKAAAKTLIAAYGINAAVCREAVRMAAIKKDISFLLIESLFPLPEKIISKAFKGVKTIIVPELNLGLYAACLKSFLTPKQELISITKVNGELFSPEEIIKQGGIM